MCFFQKIFAWIDKVDKPLKKKPLQARIKKYNEKQLKEFASDSRFVGELKKKEKTCPLHFIIIIFFDKDGYKLASSPGSRCDNTCAEGFLSLPIALLRCLNLSEGMSVEVTSVTSTTSQSTTQTYSSVPLEPLSYEDWEIIQYNGEFITHNLLEQIDVVNDSFPFPLHIGDTKVYLKSSHRFRFGFVKLGRTTTIDIKPLSKTTSATTTTSATMSSTAFGVGRSTQDTTAMASHKSMKTAASGGVMSTIAEN
ncbi:hypothetical protein RFI_19775, partial [Reticulomyxa filosa]